MAKDATVSGYKGRSSEQNSPMFRAGCEDGAEDTRLNSQHPGGQAHGPDPEKAWSWMYRRGYERTFDPAAAHLGCKECDKEAAMAKNMAQ
jgi:hypothetical protein